jgi:hypothetical protein
MNKTNLWRYALLSMLLTYVSFSTQGQVTLKYDTTLIKKIANDVCGCYQNIDISDIDVGGGPLIAEKCANTKILKYRQELNLFTDLSEEELESETVQYKTSTVIGMRLMPFLYRDCPEFIRLMKERASREREEYQQEEMTEEKATEAEEYTVAEDYEYSFSGKVKEIKQIDNLAYILIENEKGEARQFLWLNRFYGDELLMNDLESTKKEKVRIEFNETEQLNPKTKKMETYQQINWIEITY